MPENETLNSDIRWRPFRERLDLGESLTDIFPDLEAELYRFLRRNWKQLKHHGVDPSDLLNAALNSWETLRELVEKSGSNILAQLLRDVVAAGPSSNRKELLCRWLDAIWDCVRDQLQLDCHEASRSGDFAQVEEMKSRLVRLLDNRPSRIPPRPSRDESSDIDKILSLVLC